VLALAASHLSHVESCSLTGAVVHVAFPRSNRHVKINDTRFYTFRLSDSYTLSL
jgi:hypothetical protein